MRGAYCLDCAGDGPDLELVDDKRVPPGVQGRIAFTCGNCGTSWTWDVLMTSEGFVYGNPQRAKPNYLN